MTILMALGFPAFEIDLNQVFKATILITLALAIFDLVKTIFQEEVLGKHEKHESLQNRTMARFLGSIIIALAHQQYVNLSVEEYKKLLTPNGVLIDVKGIQNRTQMNEENIRYWQL